MFNYQWSLTVKQQCPSVQIHHISLFMFHHRTGATSPCEAAGFSQAHDRRETTYVCVTPKGLRPNDVEFGVTLNSDSTALMPCRAANINQARQIVLYPHINIKNVTDFPISPPNQTFLIWCFIIRMTQLVWSRKKQVECFLEINYSPTYSLVCPQCTASSLQSGFLKMLLFEMRLIWDKSVSFQHPEPRADLHSLEPRPQVSN